jgi:hypothetical protein
VSFGNVTWPPRTASFVPRLGDYLARLEQQPIEELLARPAALGRALRQASKLLGLQVECLDVPGAWILRSAGWPTSTDGQGLGPPPAELLPAAETTNRGPLATVRQALAALPPASSPLATLLALPSPAVLGKAAGADRQGWARGVLQLFLRLVGEGNVVTGVMFEGDDGASSLAGVLSHYGLAPVCIRGVEDRRPAPAGALIARALPLAGPVEEDAASADRLITTDGAVHPSVPPEDLLRASRRWQHGH